MKQQRNPAIGSICSLEVPVRTIVGLASHATARIFARAPFVTLGSR